MANKTDYIKLVSDITGENYSSTKAKMTKAKTYFEITFREYYINKFYTMTLTQQAVKSRRINVNKKNRESYLNNIIDATGFTKKEIDDIILQINKKYDVRINRLIYWKYEIFRYEGAALDVFMAKIKRRNQLKQEIISLFNDIDDGKLEYTDIVSQVSEFYSLISELLSEHLKIKFTELISISRPDIKDDPVYLERVMVDMEVTRQLLDFTFPEYVSFHFADKTLAEKREFISDVERMKIMNAISDTEKYDVLDNKYATYMQFKKYYRRKLVYVDSKDDYEQFRKFCRRLDTIVVKPVFSSLGRGVKPITLDKNNLKTLFLELLDEYGFFIAEELILPHTDIRKLNPDSVNTVRLITYFDGNKTIIHKPFMKVGQKGSFVDNGGAGGIFVSVDPETGKLSTHGCDENGVIYETHPYTGVKFKGYQLPNWDKALKLGHKLSDKIPGLCYIGWDITCNEKGQWIIVEGNAKTQFMGQQCTTDIGARKNFIKTVSYKQSE